MSRTPLVILASELGFMLQEAIEKKDWNIVCQVFSELTGEDIEAPIDSVEIVDANSYVKEFLSAVRKELQQEKKTQTKKPTKKSVKKLKDIIETNDGNGTIEVVDNFTVKGKRKKATPVLSNGKNKFESMHEAIAEAGQDKNFYKIDDNIKPVERTRRPFSEREVECSECKKRVKVHPMFIKENYICDNCIQKRTRGGG
jgi:hypothetical protein